MMLRAAALASIVIALIVAACGGTPSATDPNQQVVLRVEGSEYTRSHLANRIELELKDGAAIWRIGGSLPLGLPDFVMSRLEGEAALVAGIDEIGLEVTDDEVAAELRRQGRERELRQDENESMVRASIAAEKAFDYFLSNGPDQEPQARGGMIVVETDEAAQAAFERLESGENFVTVAEGTTIDVQSIEIDWFPRGGELFVFEEMEDYFFNGEVGVASEPIQLFGLFYIVEVVDRDDARELTESQREDVANREVLDFITALSESLDIERNFTEDDAIAVLYEVY